MARSAVSNRFLTRDMGQAAVFNGTSSKIDVTNSTPLSVSQNISIGCWVKNKRIIGAGFGSFMCKGTIEAYELDYDQANNAFRFVINRSASSYKQINGSTNTAVNGLWCHIAGTCDTVAGSVKLYINGQQIASSTFTPETLKTTTDALGIGYRSGSNDRFSTSVIDEPFVYNHGTAAVLTQAQIQDIYLKGVYPSSGLAWLSYLDGNANDVSGNANDGTATSVSYTTNVARYLRSAATNRVAVSGRVAV